MTDSINALVQRGVTDALVSLFRLDMSSYGGPLLHFTPVKRADAVDGSAVTPASPAGVTFGGVYFEPVDVEFTGFEISTVGALPRPKIKVSNTNEVFQGFVNAFGDLLGCPVQRVRTFRRFLDDGSAPDPTAYFGPDAFLVDRKSAENNRFIEWELSASLDNWGRNIPNRLATRTCLWRYRRWTGTAFDYSKVQCPYTGAGNYDRNQVGVTPDKDVCSRDLTGCKTRFGSNAPLPFGGFPGLARTSP